MPVLMYKCLTNHRCVYHGQRPCLFGISWLTSRGPEPRPRPESFLPRCWASRWPLPGGEGGSVAAGDLTAIKSFTASQGAGAFGSAGVPPLAFLGPHQGRKPGVTRLTEAPIKMSKHPACWVPALSPKREAFASSALCVFTGDPVCRLGPPCHEMPSLPSTCR